MKQFTVNYKTIHGKVAHRTTDARTVEKAVRNVVRREKGTKFEVSEIMNVKEWAK